MIGGEITIDTLRGMAARVKPETSLVAAFIVDRTRAPGEMVRVEPEASAAAVQAMFPLVGGEVQAIREREPGRAVMVLADRDWRSLVKSLPPTDGDVFRHTATDRLMGAPIFYVPDPSLVPESARWPGPMDLDT
jgi:hypothetical protein